MTDDIILTRRTEPQRRAMEAIGFEVHGEADAFAVVGYADAAELLAEVRRIRRNILDRQDGWITCVEEWYHLPYENEGQVVEWVRYADWTPRLRTSVRRGLLTALANIQLYLGARIEGVSA